MTTTVAKLRAEALRLRNQAKRDRVAVEQAIAEVQRLEADADQRDAEAAALTAVLDTAAKVEEALTEKIRLEVERDGVGRAVNAATGCLEKLRTDMPVQNVAVDTALRGAASEDLQHALDSLGRARLSEIDLSDRVRGLEAQRADLQAQIDALHVEGIGAPSQAALDMLHRASIGGAEALMYVRASHYLVRAIARAHLKEQAA